MTRWKDIDAPPLPDFVAREYLPTGDIFAEESDQAERCKQALTKLSEEERTIIIRYAETRSIRATARNLGATPQAIHRRIVKIRQQIIDYINNH